MAHTRGGVRVRTELRLTTPPTPRCATDLSACTEGLIEEDVVGKGNRRGNSVRVRVAKRRELKRLTISPLYILDDLWFVVGYLI